MMGGYIIKQWSSPATMEARAVCRMTTVDTPMPDLIPLLQVLEFEGLARGLNREAAELLELYP